MHTFWRRVALAVALFAAAQGTLAAELALERTAVEKLLMQTLFTNAGRYEMQAGNCFAYLEKPGVELKDGRIRIRSFLNARIGLDTGLACIGVNFASWTVASGRPVASGGKVRLEDLRVDDVADPAARLLLKSGLLANLPGAIELDVLGAVRSMLQGSGAALLTSVEVFQIDSAAVADGRLAVKFNFRLLAR